uniref:F-box domain-containing protein n=1 Tax=Rhizophagus irregularis (strain DAOM 181602 / DAOM 197198 / MUCL 43194) TaxID=747089 RepID=U9U6K3_RHIID
MACSKICSGNLVELAEEIIQYLRDDISSLYSCILVNRLWCRIAIPLLWEDPFSVPTQKFDFIKILLRSLNDEDKTRLIVKYGFNNNEFSPKTLFNYPGFIKRLNTQNIRFCIENWVPNLTNNFANSANLFYCNAHK